jgi:6-phosphogluconolactonase (cycloisomerase 2 family)
LSNLAAAQKNEGLELLYGAPSDAFINIFPAMVIDPTNGGFLDVFNVLAPPPFICSGGIAASNARFLYVSIPPQTCLNQEAEIIGYRLNSASGVPAALPSSPFVLRNGSSPNGMATVPNRPYLYVADAGYIDAFKIDAASGALTPIAGSPVRSGTNYELAVDPGGKFLYASDYDAPGGVFAFTIGAGGELTRVSGSPFKVPGPAGSDNQPVGIVDTGKFVYIALANTNQIAGFSIHRKTGALKPLAGALAATGNGPVPLVLTGNFLYTVNVIDGTISGYSINATTGALTPIPGSPFGSDGADIAVDVSGQYLYLSGHRGVQGYNIDPTTGALTEGEASHGNDGTLWLTVVQLPAPE